MRIVQVTPVLAYGDGVGNDIVAMDRVLKEQGYDTQIYAIDTDKRLQHLSKKLDELPRLEKKDILLYHMAVGSAVTEKVMKLKCFKTMIYHNITPDYFYEGYNQGAVNACREGIKQTKQLNKNIDYCLAVSEFNKKDLERYGYSCPIDVLPIVIPFEDYDKEFDQETYKKYNDGCTNIVFTGRIAPNKKQEDVITSFYYYKKYWNPNARLILVGGYNDADLYYQKLVSFVKELHIEDVVFTGHIGFAGILSCYKVADVFVCMSEHEGFCIPLVEAMHFKKPIIAYDAAAVRDTMGRGTMVIPEKNCMEVAGLINYVVTHPEVQQAMVEKQNQRLSDFKSEKVEKKFLAFVQKMVEMSQTR